jgi:triacylglycerol esterase/lipase EstA (alpha/beta hydrolase family)
MWCLRPVGYLWRLERKKGKGQPILLVHGYMHDSSAWIYHIWRLTRQGFGPIYMLNLKHPFLPIMEYAKRVEAKAQQIEKETGRKDLILIGHSMGGLVSSFYATQVAPEGKVTHVITIGSPLAGTYVAKIAMGPNGRQMGRGCVFLKDLKASILSSKGIQFYHMGTKTDELVIPYSSAFIPENKQQFIVNDIGHVSLLYSPRIADKIISWLTDRDAIAFDNNFYL